MASRSGNSEGFNTKMTDAEIADLGRRHRTDVLLAGMQLNFIDDVVRGVAALRPKVVVLYPPHEYFHAMMGAVSRAPGPHLRTPCAAAFPISTCIPRHLGSELALSAGGPSHKRESCLENCGAGACFN